MMRKLSILVLAVLLSATWLPAASAAEMAGVTLEDSISIGGTDVPLAGAGIRKKVVIKVYVAGLYMAGPSNDPAAIISTDQARALAMHFVYKKVGAEKLKSSWREGFEKNTPAPSPELAKKMDQFVGMFTEDALKGDKYTLTYNPGEGTKVVLKGVDKGTIPGADFASALMGIWFGDYPADKGLKKSVLKGL
jgi:hypothetical protein